MAEFTEIDIDGVPMRICSAVPSGAGPHPAMVVMFHRDAFDDFTLQLLDDLSELGFVAVAPDVYHWPPVADPPRENPLPLDPGIARDIGATLEWLGERGDVDGERLGIIGHCMGGRMAFVGASLFPQFKACVSYYGGNMFAAWSEDGPTAFDMLPQLRATVQAIFGNEDGNPSPQDADRLEQELTRLGIEHEFHRYDGAGHAFQNFCNPDRFRPDQTSDSWAKTVAFLESALGV